MPEVKIKNLHSKTIHCKAKTEKLLDILLRETDWMHACGKNGRCTTCSAIIVSGSEHLSEISEAETRFIKLGKLSAGIRLACQCEVHGNIEIKVPEAYKLPHLDYSE
ncbi:MAG: 2Fe-2S iron-sulfur cluster-binding protein [Marinoscillum sp.]